MSPFPGTASSGQPSSGTRYVPHHASLATVGAWLARAWHRLRRRHCEYRTRQILEALDDRTLHDIGIDRSEIASVARGQGTDRSIHYIALF